MKDKLKSVCFILLGALIIDMLVIVFLAQEDIARYVELPYSEMFKPLLTPIETFDIAKQHKFFNLSQIIVGGIALYFCYELLTAKKNVVKESNEIKVHGDAEWAKPTDYMNGKAFHNKVYHFKKNGLKNVYKNPPGTFFGLMNNKPLIMHDEQSFGKHTRIPNLHTFVVGDSGAYKTYTFVLPNLLKETNRSLVIIDVKGSMVRRTAHIKKKQGYDIKVFDFIDFAIGNKHNPLDYISDPNDTRKVANGLISNLSSKSSNGNDYWQDSAEFLLTALINYVLYSGVFEKQDKHMGTILDLFLSQDSEMSTSDFLTGLFESLENSNPAKISWKLFLSQLEAKEMMSSIFGTLNNRVLSLWLSNKLREFTKSDEWNLNDFVNTDQKTVLYITIPEADDTYRLLVNSFFVQLFRLISDSGRMNGKIPTQPIIILDEFANLGMIPKYETILTTVREYGVKICTLVQNLSQLDHIYGKHLRNTIIANHATQLVLGINDPETGRYYSDKLGKQTLEGTLFSKSSSSRGGSTSESKQYYKREMKTAQELETKSSNESLLLTRGFQPAKIQVVNIFDFFHGVFTKEDEKNMNPLKYQEIEKSDEQNINLLKSQEIQKSEVTTDERKAN